MEMVQQDFNFRCSFEDSVAVHDKALPFDLTGIMHLCDEGPLYRTQVRQTKHTCAKTFCNSEKC